MPSSLTVRTPTLEIGYEAHGDATGFPIVLLHGFPDDARAWDAVAPPLSATGCRVLVPYLRGYGPTHFLDPAAPRMAQQAAIAQDLLDFMDALSLARVGLAGYDWGGRAACITAILAPERVQALVTIGGYNVQNTLAAPRAVSADEGKVLWYQWYFNTERGGPASSSIAAPSVGSSGRSGHRPGVSTTPPSTARPRPSIIPISCPS